MGLNVCVYSAHTMYGREHKSFVPFCSFFFFVEGVCDIVLLLFVFGFVIKMKITATERLNSDKNK